MSALTEKEKARKLALYHQQRKAMTPEELEAVRVKKRAYDEAHYQRTIAYQKERHKNNYAANKKAAKQEAAKYRQRMRENPELRARYNAAIKARLDANGGVKRKAAKARYRAWREKNAARLKAKQKEYYLKNYRKNYAAYHLASQKRKALQRAATINLRGIREFVKAVQSKPTAICYYCQKRVPTTGIHLDHIVALSKGGLHAVENLCVACSVCNLSKGAKSLVEWARENASQQLLNL